MKLSKFTPVLLCCSLLLGACHTTKKTSYIRSFHNEIKFDMDSVKVTLRDDTVHVVYPELAMFDFGKDEIKGNAKPSLERFSRLLTQYNKINFIINGYTDNVGADDVNHPLSKRRAENVEQFFQMHGIAKSRMRTHGMGAANPIMDNSTEQGRQANRRVEMLLYRRK